MEIWKNITNYENLYEISNLGNVRTIRNGKLRKATINNEYLRITLSNKGKQKNIYIHRLVATHFIDNPENKPEINHINCNKLDNNVSNLEWCTTKENIAHSFLHNRRNTAKGEASGVSKLKESDILNIRMDKQNKMSTKAIASKYNIVTSHVRGILNGKLWKHIN